MALSNPRGIFGVHSVTPYKTDTGEFYGTFRVLGSSSLTLDGETIDLLGGSSRYPWDSEVGSITAEMSLVFREYPDWLYEVFLGRKATSDLNGGPSEIKNVVDIKGNILAGSEITGVTATTATDLKFGKYTAVAKTATTIDLFISTNIDLNRGTPGQILDDSLAIARDLDVSGDAEVANFGFTINGAATGMNVGDTFGFDVRTENSSNMEVEIGAASDTFPEFGAIIMANKRGNNGLFQIDAYRCKAAGAPIGTTEKEWSESEVTVKMNYDSTRNAVFKIEALD